jgi:uncharacterized membrane protein YbhN (UPF0104 family)
VFLNKNIKILLNYFLGPLVFLLLSYSIYLQVQHQPDWRQSLEQIKQAVTGPLEWKIGLVLILMPLNWGLEARKWQLSIRLLQPISFWRAFKATLTGTTMASFTPNRMGEYLGRLLYVEEGKRLQSISLSMVCSLSQLLITGVAGGLGILYLKGHLHNIAQGNQAHFQIWLSVLLAVVLAALLVFAIIYFRMSWLVSWLGKFPSLGKFLTYVKVLKDFNSTILIQILLLSFGRYLVFIIQYFLLFSVFGVLLTWGQTFAGISVMFLVMAVVPTFTFLTELGLRWEASIQILELFSANKVGIFAASLGIWLINLVIPALIGSLLILSIKLSRNR